MCLQLWAVTSNPLQTNSTTARASTNASYSSARQSKSLDSGHTNPSYSDTLPPQYVEVPAQPYYDSLETKGTYSKLNNSDIYIYTYVYIR